MGGVGLAISVNDDDLRVSYDGAWQRNGNREVPAVSEPLTVTVTDSGTTTAKAADAGVRTISVNNDEPQIVARGQPTYRRGHRAGGPARG